MITNVRPIQVILTDDFYAFYHDLRLGVGLAYTPIGIATISYEEDGDTYHGLIPITSHFCDWGDRIDHSFGRRDWPDEMWAAELAYWEIPVVELPDGRIIEAKLCGDVEAKAKRLAENFLQRTK